MVSFIISIVSFAYLLFIDDSYFVNIAIFADICNMHKWGSAAAEFDKERQQNENNNSNNNQIK